MTRYSRTVCLIAFTLMAVGIATSRGAGAGDTPAPAGKPLDVVFFFSPTCHECQKVKQVLPAILQRWGSRLAVQMRNIEDMQLFSQLLEYEKFYKVQVAAPPAIFVGGQALVGESQIIARLDAAIAEETARGSATFMPGAPTQAPAAGADNMPTEILTRFEGFSVGAVAVAGLIDGINPCAFTTIVFFLSMLAYLKKTRSQMLAVGIGFTAGMFAAYFLLGLGMLVAVKSLAVSHGLSTALTWGVAAFAFGLAIWSLVDAVLYLRTGDTGKMTLGLPASVKQRIHKVIRTGLTTRGLVIGSVTVGFLVSILESLCTGQVYLPTIVFMTRAPGLRSMAVAYLLLYNVMFIVPLLAILAMAYVGLRSETLGQFLRGRLAVLKFGMAALFAVLGLLTIATL
jgi:hypothetical protein